jgi:TolB protein
MGSPTFAAIAVLVAVIVGGASPSASNSRSTRETGTKIAFSCTGDICVVNADGSGRLRLTRDKWIDSYPAWSPDGRRVAFTGNLGRFLIFVVNADGSDRRRLTPLGGNDACPAWSPDGRTIAYDNNRTGEIDGMNADGSERHPLIRRTASLPSWSPDGRRLAFVSGDGRKLALTSGDIYVSRADGNRPRLLVRDGTFPAWSPDGTRIAFLRNKRTWSKEVAVWIMNADGSDQRRVWRHSDEGGGVSWSPDSRSIAVTSDSDIYVISADGSAARKLVVRGDDVDPAWQPMPRRA